MSQKRKISVRKVLQVLLTLVVTAGCITAVLSASRIENEKKLTAIDIQINNGNKYHFINKQQVMDMLINNRHIDIQSLPIGRLDIHSMESIIDANPWVANAEVFIDNMHVLHVYVTQRVPVARVFEHNGNSYYIDTTLTAIPLSAQYVYYTTVVTNVPELKDDSTSRSLKGQIISLVRFIERDPFWNAQISQISMDTDNTFELMPVLGNQRIVFGDTSRMKDKFDNLFVFYKKVLNHIGWDKYQTLDVRFKDQVVASPSFTWKGPVDKDMNSMNWVKSIIESGAKNKDNDAADVIPVKDKKETDKKEAKSQRSVKEISQKKVSVIIPRHKPPGAIKAKEKPKPRIIKEKPKTVSTKKNAKNKPETPKYIYQ